MPTYRGHLTTLQRDRRRVINAIRRWGYKMTPQERRDLIASIPDLHFLFPFRYDRGYRRIYGHGDKRPRPVTVNGLRGVVMEQNGICWFVPPTPEETAELKAAAERGRQRLLTAGIL